MTEETSYRNICFTLHDYVEDDIIKLEQLKYNYLVLGKEICPTTGRKHLQGYIEFPRSNKFSTIKKKLGQTAHIEARRGTSIQAADYCKKDGDFLEYGKISEQGKRNDLLNFYEGIIDGKTVEEITLSDESHIITFIRFNKALKNLESIVNQNAKRTAPTVVWIHGPGGVGKTRFVHDFCELYNLDIYIKDPINKWWDGYNKQPVILIDDIDINYEYRALLRLLDRYKYQPETKGGQVSINSPFIFITCDRNTRDFLQRFEDSNPNMWVQLDRRIHFDLTCTSEWYRSEDKMKIHEICEKIFFNRSHVKISM